MTYVFSGTLNPAQSINQPLRTVYTVWGCIMPV